MWFPAVRLKGLLIPQFSVYGVVPPVIFNIAVPLLPLAQETLVVTGLTLIVSG